MARGESWETVARALAARMVYHAHCDATTGGTTDSGIPVGPPAHPTIEDGLADGCPFCEDRAAYARFLAKAATTRKA